MMRDNHVQVLKDIRNAGRRLRILNAIENSKATLDMAENASRGSKNEGPLDLLPSAESTHVVRRTRRGDRHEFQNHLVELLNSPVAKASLSLNISCCATEGVASDGACATLLL